MEHKGWNEFEIGSVLMSFNKEVDGIANTHSENRDYSENNSFNASVAHWRVNKPIFNKDHCINCYFCWIYCPDSSILVRDESMSGVDYVHCKGCGVCAEVCPTNPKSLIMFIDRTESDEALKSWPTKDLTKKEKEQKDS